MISTVSFEETEYAAPPYKFEAGTPNIAGAVGLGAAIDYISALGLEAIGAHERALLDDATRRLEAFNRVRIIGTAKHKASVLSLPLDGAPPPHLRPVPGS